MQSEKTKLSFLFSRSTTAIPQRPYPGSIAKTFIKAVYGNNKARNVPGFSSIFDTEELSKFVFVESVNDRTLDFYDRDAVESIPSLDARV